MTNHKIGFICPSVSWGGLEQNVLKLARWLKNLNWEIIIFCHPQSELSKQAKANDIKTYSLISKSKFNDLFLVHRLAQQIKAENIKIMILHLTRNMPLAVLTKLYSGNYFSLFFMQHMHLGGSKKNPYHCWLYNKFDRWIAPLPIFVEYLKEHSHFDISKAAVIPFGIELERFTEKRPSKSIARDRLKLPHDAVIVGMIGRLDEKKCQHVLIEACFEIHQSGHKIHILLLGDRTLGEQSSYAERLHTLTRTLKLNDYIHFRESIKEVEYAYAALDIFALTTGSETYGMVTIEAMASNLPVIATNEGGSKDIIKENVNGLLVKPLDSNELTEAILSLITNHEKASQLVSQAKRDALDKFSHTRQCDKLTELFNSFLK